MKKRIMIAALFTMAILLLSCTKKTESVPISGIGNSMGNIRNGGYVVSYENRSYFINDDDHSSLYTTDLETGTTVKMVDGLCYELNLRDKWIYYTAGSPGKLWRVSTDGKTRKQIINSLVSNTWIKDDTLYYILSEDDDWGKLFAMSLTDNSKTLLVENTSAYCVTADDRLYYRNRNDDNALWEMSLQGGSVGQRVKEGDMNDLLCDDTYVYYSDYKQNGHMYRLNMETREEECLTEDTCWKLNLYNGWIYYRNQTEKGSLYRIKTDGTGREKLRDGNISHINIDRNTVFYRSISDDIWYSVPLSEE